jgi:hypothetical protein
LEVVALHGGVVGHSQLPPPQAVSETWSKKLIPN